jgi:hypothetical protein
LIKVGIAANYEFLFFELFCATTFPILTVVLYWSELAIRE